VSEFKILKDDPVRVIFGQPGPDTFPATALADEADGKVLCRVLEFKTVVEREVDRKLIIWMRGTTTSERFHEWQAGRRG
jgi:hypothetical protein